MRHSEETMHLVRQLEAARKVDLGAKFGSGPDVTITNYTNGTSIVEPVTIPADAAGQLLYGLVGALEIALSRRRDMLRSDLSAVDRVLGGNQG